MAEDDIVLSFGDSLLRKSDIVLLNTSSWTNDKLINFCYEYFEREQFNHSVDRIALIRPSVAQFARFASVDDLVVLLEPFHLGSKQYIFVPINNTLDSDHIGRTQWSLLVYIRDKQEFQHYDTCEGSNQCVARKLMDKLQPVVHAPKSRLKFVEMAFPQKENFCDTGMYIVAVTEHLIKEFCECFSVAVTEIVNQEIVEHKRKQIQDLIQVLSTVDSHVDHHHPLTT